MTPEPSPTPFDIVPIPAFAYVPTGGVWVLVLLIGAAAIFAAYHLARGRRLNREQLNLHLLIIAELKTLRTRAAASKLIDKESCARLSALLRRYLTLRCGCTIWQLTASELERASAAQKRVTIRHLIEDLIGLESRKYAPAELSEFPAGRLDEIQKHLESFDYEARAGDPHTRRP